MSEALTLERELTPIEALSEKFSEVKDSVIEKAVEAKEHFGSWFESKLDTAAGAAYDVAENVDKYVEELKEHPEKAIARATAATSIAMAYALANPDIVRAGGPDDELQQKALIGMGALAGGATILFGSAAYFIGRNKKRWEDYDKKQEEATMKNITSGGVWTRPTPKKR